MSYVGQTTCVRPLGHFTDGIMHKSVGSPPLGIAKRMENNEKKDSYNSDMSGKPFTIPTAIKETGIKNRDKLNCAYSTLFTEVEKFQKWKTFIEIECKNKDKKLQEYSQKLESQRKVILDFQLKNENLSLQITEEMQQKTEVMQKFHSTRELCNALKKHFDTLQEKFQYCCQIKDAIDAADSERRKSIEDLTKKFESLHIKSSEKIAYLNSALAAETNKAMGLEDEFSKYHAESEGKLKSMNELLESTEIEKNNLCKDLESEKKHSAHLLNERNEHLLGISLLTTANDKAMNQLKEMECKHKDLQDKNVEIENNYLSACTHINELKGQYSEVEQTLCNLKKHAEENNASLNQSITNLEIALDDEKKKVEEEQNKCKALLSQLQKMQVEKNDLEKHASKAISEAEKQRKDDMETIEGKLRTALEEKNKISYDLNEARKMISENEDHLELLKAQLEEGKNTILSMKKEVAFLKENLQKSELEKMGVKKQVTLLKEELENSDSEKTSIKKDFILLKEDLQNSELQKKVLLKQEKELKNQILEFKDVCSRIKSDKERQEKDFSEKEGEFLKRVKLCEELLTEAEQKVCSFSEYEELQNKIKKLESDLESCYERSNVEQEKVTQLEMDVNQKSQVITDLQAEISDLQKRITEEAEKLIVCEECKILNEKHASLMENLTEKTSEIEKLKEMLKESQTTEKEMKVCLEDYIKMCDDAQKKGSKRAYEREAEILKLKDKISSLEDKLNFGDAKIFEFNCLKGKVTEYETLIEKMKEEKDIELKKLQQENNNLKASLDELKKSKKLDDVQIISETTQYSKFTPQRKPEVVNAPVHPTPIRKVPSLVSKKKPFDETDSFSSDNYLDIEEIKKGINLTPRTSNANNSRSLNMAKCRSFNALMKPGRDILDIPGTREIKRGINAKSRPSDESNMRSLSVAKSMSFNSQKKPKRDILDIPEAGTSLSASNKRPMFSIQKPMNNTLSTLDQKQISYDKGPSSETKETSKVGNSPSTPNQRRFFKTRTPGKVSSKPYFWF